MIEKLAVKNFKSIKKLDIDCRRVNLFIGEPNTGKSNILETLGLCSWIGHIESQGGKINEFLRFEVLQDLFFDGILDEKIEVIINPGNFFIQMNFFNGNFELIGTSEKQRPKLRLEMNHTGDITDGANVKSESGEFSFLKYYKFLKQNNFPLGFSSHLLPPNGSNLFALAMGSKKISERMTGFFEHLNLNIMLKTRDRTFEIVKQRDNRLISYPYTSTSDTLQRIIFFTIAMESNKNSTLTFEEPESFAFPYYTKYLGERIAFDETNQYFISTHNPYLLLAVLEKTPKDQVNVFATYLEDYETKVKPLAEGEISILMDSDPFFNLNRFIEEE